MNNQIFFKLYSIAHQSYFLDKIIVFCAEYLPIILIIGVLIYLLYRHVGVFDWRNPFGIIKSRIKDVFYVFIPAVLGWVVADIIKSVVRNPRPFEKFSEEVSPIFTHGGMDSFPSGHATFFMILALGIFSINKKLGYLMFFFALIIGLTRIISGVHFPVDILCGYILGAILSFIFRIIFVKKTK